MAGFAGNAVLDRVAQELRQREWLAVVVLQTRLSMEAVALLGLEEQSQPVMRGNGT